jgi:broad specificity phosphatase PhoE
MSTIYLIRHAEKPNGAATGVDHNGAEDSRSLVPRGWQRAGALATFFAPKNGLRTPDHIFAAAAGKEKIAPHVKVGSKSARPLETVMPLAAKLGLTPGVSYAKGDEQALVMEIVALAGTTVISWQHDRMTEIAQLILGPKGNAPQSWPADRFDVVWCFENDGSGNGWAFSQVCQQLLVGDGAQPIQG